MKQFFCFHTCVHIYLFFLHLFSFFIHSIDSLLGYTLYQKDQCTVPLFIIVFLNLIITFFHSFHHYCQYQFKMSSLLMSPVQSDEVKLILTNVFFFTLKLELCWILSSVFRFDRYTLSFCRTASNINSQIPQITS